jgi:Abhydrolase family
MTGIGRAVLAAGVLGCVVAAGPAFGAPQPTPEMLRVLQGSPEPGPRITALLRHQLDRAWAQDDTRRARFEAVRTEADLLALQRAIRAKALEIIGGLPSERSNLEARIIGTIPRDGYRIEKLVFESLPGFHVTALVYVPDLPAGPKPAVLVPCGHSPLGKAYPAYQEIAGRLAKRGYVVLCWDPVGQGERSQFWDAARSSSRYNLVCGEHAILGNLATLAGASLLRWEIWDGMRAVDYLRTRPDVDGGHIAITGTSGGGLQSTWIGALDDRIGFVAPSCFVTALPMRMANRIFEDPDSDPEQDPDGLVAQGVGHPGLLLLDYPRWVHVSAAVQDFVPIEGTRKTLREVGALYRAFGKGDRLVLAEGYHTHQYSLQNQASAFASLDRWSGRSGSAELPAVAALGPEVLRCTRSGQVRVDLEGRSLPEIIRDYYREHRGRVLRIGELYRAGLPETFRGGAVGPYVGGDVEKGIGWEAAGTAVVGAATIDRYVLHHDGGLVLPLLYIHREGPTARRVVLRVGLAGKAGVEDWPVVEADLARGDGVVSFDPRGLGETALAYKAVSIDDPALAKVDDATAYVSPVSGVLANYAYNALLTGRPYFLEMIEDADVAARFAREKLGAQSVAVGELGDARTLAVAIAGALPGVRLLPPQSGAPAFSWAEVVEDQRETWPIQYLVPGGAYLDLEGSGQ